MNQIFLINSTGAILLIVFLIFANTRKVNQKGNKWFGVFCLSIFLILLEQELIILQLGIKSEFVLELLNLPSFVVAPTFYLSVVYFVNPTKVWKAKYYWHFSFGILYLSLILFKYLNPFSLEIADDNNGESMNIFSILFLVLFAVQLLSYAFYSYKTIVVHQKNIKVFSSNVENIDLKWLQYIIIIVGILTLTWVIEIMIAPNNENPVTFIILFISIYIIAFYALKQKEIYPFKTEEQEDVMELFEQDETENDVVEKKKLIPDEKLEAIKERLLAYLEKEKPYLDSELSLIKLSKALGTSTHVLSYVINSGFNESFYQFINKYRVKEAQKLIIDPKMNHLSLLGIGYEVGFNSKSVFNSVFKNITGVTPSDFKKTHSR